MTSTTLFGIAVIPAIVGLVQVAKQMGMSGRFAPLLSVLLGVAASVADVVAAQSPTASAYVGAVFTGIALGLAAAGLYSGVRTILPPDPDAADAPPTSTANR